MTQERAEALVKGFINEGGFDGDRWVDLVSAQDTFTDQMVLCAAMTDFFRGFELAMLREYPQWMARRRS